MTNVKEGQVQEFSICLWGLEMDQWTWLGNVASNCNALVTNHHLPCLDIKHCPIHSRNPTLITLIYIDTNPPNGHYQLTIIRISYNFLSQTLSTIWRMSDIQYVDSTIFDAEVNTVHEHHLILCHPHIVTYLSQLLKAFGTNNCRKSSSEKNLVTKFTASYSQFKCSRCHLPQ